MKLVLDTNIVFSALLNPNSNIGTIILSENARFEFYSCALLKIELKRHWKKLLKISKLSNTDLENIYDIIQRKITFISHELISLEIIEFAHSITRDIDHNDADFVALTKYLEATLWTGDKTLYQGLKKKKFNSLINTTELFRLINNLS